MKVQFVCLANSIKLNGRCVAGTVLLNNNPVLNFGNPTWVRPVSEMEHGEISTALVSQTKLLDILEIDLTKNVGNGFQSENVLFDSTSLKKIGTLPYDHLTKFVTTSTDSKIFGNHGKSVHKDVINMIDYSLLMICLDEFSVKVIDSTKLRLLFTYNGFGYDLPITDPDFIRNYNSNNQILEGKSEIFVTISLAVEHNEWHSKLIAGIMYN